MYINLSAVCEDLDQELCSGLGKSDCLQFPSANTTCIQTCEICKCQDKDISTCKIADTKRCKLWPQMKELCPVSCGICKPGFLFGIIFLIYFWRIIVFLYFVSIFVCYGRPDFSRYRYNDDTSNTNKTDNLITSFNHESSRYKYMLLEIMRF